MDERIIELRNLISHYKSLIEGLNGASRDELIIQYIENLGHKFKKINLNHGLIKFSIIEKDNGIIKYINPIGKEEPVADYNAQGIWNLLETFKDDLSL